MEPSNPQTSDKPVSSDSKTQSSEINPFESLGLVRRRVSATRTVFSGKNFSLESGKFTEEAYRAKKPRVMVLDDEIAIAKARAISPSSPQSIFAELTKMAELQQGCLLGLDEDAIKYAVAGDVKFLTLKNLRDRLARHRA